MVVLALVLSGRADGLLADAVIGPSSPPPAMRPSIEGADFFPIAVAVYPSKSRACLGACVVLTEPARAVGLAYGASGVPSEALGREADVETSSRRRYLPVVFSLLVPGAGEITMGYYVRGAVLLGAEVTAWTGYGYYHSKGLDSRAEYERFADEHWGYTKWVGDHALWRDPAYEDVSPRSFEALDSIGREYWEGWPPYHTWFSKETQRHDYYETIGKYDWFISGWEDWDAQTQPRESGMRTTYRAMRRKSNDEIDKATGFIYLSIAARVISLVETVLLARRDDARRDDARRNDSDTSRENPSSGFSIKARATGIASGEVALVYRFR